MRTWLELLEFLYLILSLGFEGQYFGEKKIVREEIRNRLLHHIRQSRGKVAKRLSVHTEDHSLFVGVQQKKKSIKWLLVTSISILGIINISLNIALNLHGKDMMNHINQIGIESPITAYSQLIARPIVSHKIHSGENNEL